MRASVLDPMSGEGATEILDARAFLREVGIAALLALPLPLVGALAGWAYLVLEGKTLTLVLIGPVFLGAVIAMPVVFYASLRLNAATLARERALALAGATPLRVYPAMKGPRMLRSFVAGSVRSRLLAGFPGMFGITGAAFVFTCLIHGGALDISLFMLLPGAVLVGHAIIVVRLVV